MLRVRRRPVRDFGTAAGATGQTGGGRRLSGALTYAYNAQAAVSEDGLVVASGLTREVRDTGQLGPMLQAVEANRGEPPGVAVADKGYLTEHNLATLRVQGQRCLIGVA